MPLDLDSPLPCCECGRPSVWISHDDPDDPPLYSSRCACGFEWLDLDEIPTYANSNDMAIHALVARVRELEAALRGADALTSAVRQAFSLDYVAPELLPERVAMAGAALQTARADYEEVEQARRDLHRVAHLQTRQLNESANECYELRATLANERGEGEGPSPGWAFGGKTKTWHCADGNGMTVERWLDAEEGLCWRAVRDEQRHQLIAGVLRFTAREAMRAADKARGAS